MASKVKVEIFGWSGDLDFMRARCCAQDLYRDYPEKFEEPVIVPMLQFEWDTYINEKKREFRGEMWKYSQPSIVFVDGEVKGEPTHFIAWAKKNHNFEEFRPLPLYYALTDKSHYEFYHSKPYSYVYMDICSGTEDLGRLVIELFTDLVPRTCANFEALCTGERGACTANGDNMRLSYCNTPFHRVVPRGWIQGGDIVGGRGNDGASIYGPVFEDENFIVRHNKRGVLGMANSDRHTNHSQFYITLRPMPWMDGRYVAFGQIVEGPETLTQMEEVCTTNERPDMGLLVKDCGLLLRNSNNPQYLTIVHSRGASTTNVPSEAPSTTGLLTPSVRGYPSASAVSSYAESTDA